jgi:hypothetical protein
MPSAQFTPDLRPGLEGTDSADAGMCPGHAYVEDFLNTRYRTDEFKTWGDAVRQASPSFLVADTRFALACLMALPEEHAAHQQHTQNLFRLLYGIQVHQGRPVFEQAMSAVFSRHSDKDVYAATIEALRYGLSLSYIPEYRSWFRGFAQRTVVGVVEAYSRRCGAAQREEDRSLLINSILTELLPKPQLMRPLMPSFMYMQQPRQTTPLQQY